ncbi:hypothetical protein C5167_018513 [Papaver somniferum]|uniref:Uncharacterized protein n=1 Tax=Papaver somniferum TaxID=3469 RepID=A0A4Y7IRG2_PAPSO|nr:uncharacterized protein LOC113353555 [Papaver somniferum]RZC50079.1 hypothetical protein C5167_018513 [Papaver somniferum]
MKISNLTTNQLAVALGLCMLLLSFSYSAEATATERSITTTDVAAPAPENVATYSGCYYLGYCINEPECRKKCTPLGYEWSRCWPPAPSSDSEEQIDPNREIPTRYRCCCYNH